jgi:hypothetical protein
MATLSKFDQLNTNALPYIFTRCKNLQYLEIIDGIDNSSMINTIVFATRLSTLIIGKDRRIPLDEVTRILSRCKSLVRAEFDCIAASDMRINRLHPRLQQSSLITWDEELPNLRSLSFKGEHSVSTVSLSVLQLVITPFEALAS